jgi:hypothetical protein
MAEPWQIFDIVYITKQGEVMKESEFEELQQAAEALESAMYEFDNALRSADPHMYERWKAGGKQVSNEFVSMYPCVSEVIEKLEADVEPDDDEDDDSEEACTSTYDFENPLNSIG